MYSETKQNGEPTRHAPRLTSPPIRTLSFFRLRFSTTHCTYLSIYLYRRHTCMRAEVTDMYMIFLYEIDARLFLFFAHIS